MYGTFCIGYSCMVKFFTAFSLTMLGLNPTAKTKRRRKRKIQLSVAKIMCRIIRVRWSDNEMKI